MACFILECLLGQLLGVEIAEMPHLGQLMERSGNVQKERKKMQQHTECINYHLLGIKNIVKNYN